MLANAIQNMLHDLVPDAKKASTIVDLKNIQRKVTEFGKDLRKRDDVNQCVDLIMKSKRTLTVEERKSRGKDVAESAKESEVHTAPKAPLYASTRTICDTELNITASIVEAKAGL